MSQLLHATRRAEQDHFWFRGLRRFIRPLLDQVSDGRRDLRILDCGCGTGANLLMLAEYGWTCGVDLQMVGLRYAQDYGSTRVAQASVTHLPFPDARFDLATAIDVLYALTEEDEARAVREIRRVLRPGGAFIVNVAALRMLRGSRPMFRGELRRSTRRRLRRVLQAGGFDIVRLTYTNFFLFPLILPVRALQHLAGLATPEEPCAEIIVPPALINTLLSGLVALEGHALKLVNMPVGSSLLCLARRPPLTSTPTRRA